MSEVSWLHTSLGVKYPPCRRPLGFVRHAFIPPPRTSAKHSRHLRSPISEAFDRVCEKFVINAELNKYQRDVTLYSTSNTKLAILTYTTNSAILHALHIDNSYLHYLQNGLHTLQKPENKGGGKVW